MDKLKTFRISAKKKRRRRIALFPGRLACLTSPGKKALIAVALIIPLIFIVVLIFSKYKAC
jgi:hypothetical protein